jgi:hypothetical protein
VFNSGHDCGCLHCSWLGERALRSARPSPSAMSGSPWQRNPVAITCSSFMWLSVRVPQREAPVIPGRQRRRKQTERSFEEKGKLAMHTELGELKCNLFKK